MQVEMQHNNLQQLKQKELAQFCVLEPVHIFLAFYHSWIPRLKNLPSLFIHSRTPCPPTPPPSPPSYPSCSRECISWPSCSQWCQWQQLRDSGREWEELQVHSAPLPLVAEGYLKSLCMHVCKRSCEGRWLAISSYIVWLLNVTCTVPT